MIPTNGHILVGNSTGGGIDADGIPIPSSVEWSEEIPCRVQTVNHNNKGVYQDGKFVQSAYLLFIPLVTPFSADRVRIVHSGVDLGEFEVQDVEVLTLVGKIKITV